jgi:DNA modification methylase
MSKLKISDLTPDNKNYNKGTEFGNSLIEKSLRKFGAGRSILLDKNNRIIAGNKTIENANAIGLEDVIIVETTGNQIVAVKRMDIDLDSKIGRELALADNASAKANIEWNYDNIQQDWELSEQTEWGVNLPIFETLEVEEDDFDTTPPENPITVLGDLYEIGEHRLLCGDSTDSDAIARLMHGEKADMVFTDPPYGIGFEYNSHKDKKGDEYLKFCDEWFNNLQIVSDFIFISTGWAYQKFWWNKDPKDCFYWLSKNKRTGGSVSHFRKVEPLFIWGKPKNRYNFDFFEQVTEIINDLKGLHSCPKPITLISDIIKAVNEKDLICDIFLGSGTTMVAAHQINRKCYGMELDPKYCDVIVNRMIALDPNIEIKLNGKPFEKAH